jgi:hypothetical protein
MTGAIEPAQAVEIVNRVLQDLSLGRVPSASESNARVAAEPLLMSVTVKTPVSIGPIRRIPHRELGAGRDAIGVERVIGRAEGCLLAQRSVRRCLLVKSWTNDCASQRLGQITY